MRHASRFLRVFVPVTMMLAAIIVILVITLSVTYVKQAEEVTSESHLASLRLVSDLYEQRRFNAGPILEQVMENPDIQSYLFAMDENKYVSIIRAIPIMDSIIARNDYIHSIYLYNGKWGYLSSFSGYEGTHCFSDSMLNEFIEEGKEISLGMKLRKISFQRPGSKTKEDQDLFSMMIIHHASTPDKSYAIVVNLSESRSREIYTKNIQNTKSNFYIIDSENCFLSHPDSRFFAEKVEAGSVFSRILSLKGHDGYQILKGDDGIKYLICWTDQPTMGWRLFYMIPHWDLLRRFFSVITTIAVTTMLVLGGSLLAAIIISRKVDLSLSYERRLLHYIKGNGPCPEKLKKNADEYTAAIMRVTKEENGSFSDLSSDKALSIIRSVFKPHNGISHEGVLLNGESNIIFCITPKSVKTVFREMCHISEVIQNQSGLMLTAVVSKNSVAFEDIPSEVHLLEEYHQVQYLANRFSVDIFDEYDSAPVLFDVRNLEIALKKKSPEEFTESCNELISKLKAQPSWFGFTLLRTNLVFFIRSYINNEADLYYPRGINALTSLIVNAENLSDFSAYCCSIEEILVQSEQERRQNKTSDFVDQIDKYITANVQDINLNAASIADYMGLSLNYTRTLYKQMKGISINEAIGQQRLELARKLLKETDMTVNEIREIAGFSNYSYFCTYFKNKYQVSPSYYRIFVKNPNTDGFQNDE